MIAADTIAENAVVEPRKMSPYTWRFLDSTVNCWGRVTYGNKGAGKAQSINRGLEAITDTHP